jgi:hypothetical protein
MIPLTQF